MDNVQNCDSYTRTLSQTYRSYNSVLLSAVLRGLDASKHCVTYMKTGNKTNHYPLRRYISTQYPRPATVLQYPLGYNVPVHRNVSWTADAETANGMRIAISALNLPSYSTEGKLGAYPHIHSSARIVHCYQFYIIVKQSFGFCFKMHRQLWFRRPSGRHAHLWCLYCTNIAGKQWGVRRGVGQTRHPHETRPHKCIHTLSLKSPALSSYANSQQTDGEECTLPGACLTSSVSATKAYPSHLLAQWAHKHTALGVQLQDDVMGKPCKVQKADKKRIN
jgi:hypothetical protein